MNAAVAGE